MAGVAVGAGCVGDGVGDAVGVFVAVGDAVGVVVAVGDAVGVGDGVGEGVEVAVGVAVAVGVDDAVGEGDSDGLASSADTGCGVALGDRPQPVRTVAAAPRPASRMKSRRVRPGTGCGLISIQWLLATSVAAGYHSTAALLKVWTQILRIFADLNLKPIRSVLICVNLRPKTSDALARPDGAGAGGLDAAQGGITAVQHGRCAAGLGV